MFNYDTKYNFKRTTTRVLGSRTEDGFCKTTRRDSRGSGGGATGGKIISKAAKTGTNVVYQGIDKATGAVKYVGITQRAPAVRFGEHLNSGTAKSLLRYEVVPGATNMSRIDARIMEQTLINQHGLNNLLNIRNSIAPKNLGKYGIK